MMKILRSRKKLEKIDLYPVVNVDRRDKVLNLFKKSKDNIRFIKKFETNLSVLEMTCLLFGIITVFVWAVGIFNHTNITYSSENVGNIVAKSEGAWSSSMFISFHNVLIALWILAKKNRLIRTPRSTMTA